MDQELVAKEKLAVIAFLFAYEAGKIELGHRNVDRQVADALAGAARGPVSEIWLDSAMEKLQMPTYFELAQIARDLWTSEGLAIKPQTSNAVELRKVLTARDEIQNPPIAAIISRRIKRDEKVARY